MTYVRTKDGVYEYVDYDEFRYRANILGAYWPKIIKQADTIEELCDEFVFADEFGKKNLLDDNYKAKLQECGTFGVVHALMKQDRPKELYGAIWTDKGLIYVAKMNEKWELELLWN